MQGRSMTNTEYLLRTVRESEHMPDWQDTFSKMREELMKEISPMETKNQVESFEAEETFEK